MSTATSSEPGAARVTLEELAILLRDAAQATLGNEAAFRIRGESPSVDLEELGRLMIGEAARHGRWSSAPARN